MGKKPRSILPPGIRKGAISNAVKARAAKYLPQAIEEGLSADEYAALAGIGISHARTEIREANARFRSQLGEPIHSKLQKMQTAAQNARERALNGFAKAMDLIDTRLDAMKTLKSPDAQEIATLTRAITIAWTGMKDVTGLGFAEARAAARLKEDSTTKPALVPDVHVEFMEAEEVPDDSPA